MSRVIRLFANFGATDAGPVVKYQSKVPAMRVFLRQSPMDRACGPMSLLMALIALGVLRRDALVHAEGPQVKLARLMKRRAQAFHFTGALAIELTWLLRPVERWVTATRIKGSNNRIRSFVTERITAGEAVILGIGNSRRRLEHWLLLVGVAGKMKARGGDLLVDEFLVLDPESEAIPYCAWNGAISVRPSSPSKRPWAMPDGDGGLETISLCAAIAIARRSDQRVPFSK